MYSSVQKKKEKVQSKVLRHKQKWLSSKVVDLQNMYDKVLLAFSQKLDVIVNSVSIWVLCGNLSQYDDL